MTRPSDKPHHSAIQPDGYAYSDSPVFLILHTTLGEQFPQASMSCTNSSHFEISVGSFLINSSVGVLGFFNPAEKMGLKPNKEDVGQTLGSYGFGPGCYFVLPVLGPTTMRDSIGMLADTFVDPFAQITIRENTIFGVSGSALDYYTVKGTGAIDFRADNDQNLQSLEKNSLDLYSSYKSIYLQDRENKIKNSIEDEDEWGSLDN